MTEPVDRRAFRAGIVLLAILVGFGAWKLLDATRTRIPRGCIIKMKAVDESTAMMLLKTEDQRYWIARVDATLETRWWRPLTGVPRTLTARDGIAIVTIEVGQSVSLVAFSLDGTERWRTTIATGKWMTSQDGLIGDQFFYQLLEDSTSNELFVIETASGSVRARLRVGHGRWAFLETSASIVLQSPLDGGVLIDREGQRELTTTRGTSVGCEVGGDYVLQIGDGVGVYRNGDPRLADARPLAAIDGGRVTRCGSFKGGLVLFVETAGWRSPTRILIFDQHYSLLRAVELPNRDSFALSSEAIRAYSGELPRFIPYFTEVFGSGHTSETFLSVVDLETGNASARTSLGLARPEAWRNGDRWYWRRSASEPLRILNGTTGDFGAALETESDVDFSRDVAGGVVWLYDSAWFAFDEPHLAIVDADDFRLIRSRGVSAKRGEGSLQ